MSWQSALPINVAWDRTSIHSPIVRVLVAVGTQGHCR